MPIQNNRHRRAAAAISFVLMTPLIFNLSGCDLPGSDLPQNRHEATRFLNQATFGVTEADVNVVGVVGYNQWITDQLATKSEISYKDYIEARKLETGDDFSRSVTNYVLEAFYTRALTSKAQLRHRVAFALSEIFVVSLSDTTLGDRPEYVVAYLDLLDKAMDGTYRDLLQAVSTSQAMGIYLTFMSNAKEQPALGTSPDENYAREVMQLFSVGLYRLNPDGTPVLGADGKPIETYTTSDVKGLAKVFTGWTRNPGTKTADRNACFFARLACDGGVQAAYLPMVTYPEFHSTGEKSFLGVTIPASATPDPEGDMKIALDTLANHPNTAPFFSRMMIQKLVTSNPTPAYVKRVADKFRATNGHIGEVVKAILLDQEARSLLAPSQGTFGKLREPVLRLTALLRNFKVDDANLGGQGQVRNAAGKISRVAIGKTSDLSTSLNQSPIFSPSVFNFFRPGYVMPQSTSAQLGMVTPEFQLTTESSVTGYVNYVSAMMVNGVSSYTSGDLPQAGPMLNVSEYRSVATSDATLIATLSDRLLGGRMSTGLTQAIQNVLLSMPAPAAGTTQSVDAQNAILDQRIKAVTLLIAVAPEFLIQR